MKACVRYNQKKAIKCSKSAQLWIFTPHLPKFRAFRTLHPLNGMCFWSFNREKDISFLKKGTACGYRTQ